jgi:D-alanyl-D-alanine dipeptidase
VTRVFTTIYILFLFSCLDAPPVEKEKLVDIQTINPRIVLDIRYATQNNFLKEKVYPAPRCFVLQSVGQKLDSIQVKLESQGLGLKIFDGYRPFSVTKLMWEILPDERYVANPKNGSRHNRGAAVDVSLVDSTGVELDMPTDFDDFSETAAQDYMDLSPVQIRNRELLRSIMGRYGFQRIKSEWWHYDFKNYENFSILDYTFEQIDSMNRK